MCGVPVRAADGYLEKLIHAGFKVAVCEQTEDPAVAKKRGAKSVVAREVERLVTVEHPVRPGLAGVHGTIFTGPPEREDAALRNLTVFSDGQVERSPGGCGIAAVMAVLDAMQLLEVGFRLVHESLADPRLTAVVRRRVAVGELDGIMPEITGAAWITGEHTFLLADEDPLAEGFEF